MSAAPPTVPPGSVRVPERGARALLVVLLVWAVAFAGLLACPLAGQSGSGAALRLELVGDAHAFARALRDDWRQTGPPGCQTNAPFNPEGGCLMRLRRQLLADSLGLVPGYVGLLLFFTLSLSGAAGLRRAALAHAACLPAVAAGLFDIAENGMTGRAADDLLHFVLAHETVRDVQVASAAKWGLLGAALAVLAALALRAARGPGRRWLWAAVAAAAAGAVCLLAGAWRLDAALLVAGTRLLGVTLALLSVWRLRRPAATPPPLPGSAACPPSHPSPPAAPPAA